ncbi:transglutaminase domain-containing protein, partial [bacterium]|nr:transglutaminase domain-containing protein [bacterium]
MSNILSRTGLFLAMALLAAPLAQGQTPAVPASAATDTSAPPIVTGDIKAGIEKHIAEQIARGDGFFTVDFEGRQLRLNLVRVHLEYLASLAPTRHFACVDMASDDGQFYDIDFFLAGKADSMTVTETTVHKLNGRPYYLWEQDDEGLWGRTSVDDGSNALLGVIDGTDTFEFRYQATLPEFTAHARWWIPLAGSDDFQTVTLKSIDAPGTRD